MRNTGLEVQELRYVYMPQYIGDSNEYAHPEIRVYLYEKYRDGFCKTCTELGRHILTIRGQIDREQRVKYPYGITITDVSMCRTHMDWALFVMKKIVAAMDKGRYGHGYRSVLLALRRLGARRVVYVPTLELSDRGFRGGWVPWRFRDVCAAWVAWWEQGRMVDGFKGSMKKRRAYGAQ